MQPVRALGELCCGERVAKPLVVTTEVVDVDAALGHTGGAAGFEHRDRAVCVGLGHPSAHGPAAQPFVLEEAKLLEIVEAVDLASRIPARFLRPIEPERTSRFGTEMP